MDTVFDAATRRRPAQRRGQERIDAILDAAAQLVAERGYDGLTLSDVAERSGSAIGSLYRFFASKDQLVEALAHRISAAIAARERALPPTPIAQMSLDDFVEWYTDWMHATFREHPAIGGLLHHFGPHCAPLEERAMAPIDCYLVEHAPRRSATQRALATRMALEIVSGGLTLTVKAQASLRSAVHEIRHALRGYLREVTAPG